MDKYTERKNAYLVEQTWTLSDNKMIKNQQGNSDTIIEYINIKSIQLYYRPSRFRTNNYICIIRLLNKKKVEILSTSYESFATFVDQKDNYTPFIKNMVHLVIKKNPTVRIFKGLTVSSFIGQYLLVFIIVLIVTSIISIIKTTEHWIRTGIMLFYLIYLIKGFKKNFPKTIYYGELPDTVLP